MITLFFVFVGVSLLIGLIGFSLGSLFDSAPPREVPPQPKLGHSSLLGVRENQPYEDSLLGTEEDE